MTSSSRGFLALLASTLALPVAIAIGFGGLATDQGTMTSRASGGDLVISEPLLAVYAAQRLQQGRVPTEDQMGLLRSELANILAVAAMADAAGYAERDDLGNMILLDRARTLASGYMQDVIGGRPITDEETRAHYAETIGAGSVELQASHILLADAGTAQEVIQMLDDGADFAEMARVHSTGPSGPDGGDLGWFAPDAMVAPFSEAAMALEDGTYTAEPVETRFGWHVILRAGSRTVPPPTFEEVEQQMRQEIERARFDALVEEALATYPVAGA
jgi:peptidyl-prolyl cis-trans isomerase C